MKLPLFTNSILEKQPERTTFRSRLCQVLGTNENIEASKDSVISAISLLSSAQDSHAENISSQLNSSLDAMRKTVESSSQSSAAHLRILDEAIQKIAQDLEAKISGSIASAFEQSRRTPTSESDRFLESEDSEWQHVGHDSKYRPCQVSATLAEHNGTQITWRFFEKCLAQMLVLRNPVAKATSLTEYRLTILDASFRRMQLSLMCV